MLIIPQLGAIISLLLGVFSVVFPRKLEKLISVKATSSSGTSELQATYGGFFIGLSVYALYSQENAAFLALGFGWLSAAFVRFITFLFGTNSCENALGIVFETIIGLLCISALSL